MGNKPLVSIIITSYNYSLYLKQAIDSAIGQTYSNKEIIVVDDGSTDDSPGIIKQYRGNIKCIFKENGGQASAFNAGFKISRGDVIIFLDSDDLLSDSVVEEAVPYFKDPNIVKVHWMLNEIDASGKSNKKILPKFPLVEGDLCDEILKYGLVGCGASPYSPPTSGNAWSRKYLEKVLPIPEADYRTWPDLYLHMLAPVYGQVKAIHEAKGSYRVHGNNYSLNPLEDYINEFFIRFERSTEILSYHLRSSGHEFDSDEWPRESWFHSIHASIKDITDTVPKGKRFILADGDEWGIGEIISGRHRIHFTEQNGLYGGPPLDDAQAIREIEKQREGGASFIFFTWTTFWLLDFYSGLHHYLKSHYRSVLSNQRLIGFSLQAQ